MATKEAARTARAQATVNLEGLFAELSVHDEGGGGGGGLRRAHTWTGNRR
jgi:hypothetical protein